jgi:hypothetical protein
LDSMCTRQAARLLCSTRKERSLPSASSTPSGQALVDTMTGIAGDKHVCFEEGTHSSWLFEVLQPHVTRIAVLYITESRGPKSDARDAHALADRIRVGALDTCVFKDPTTFATLRQLVKAHEVVVRDTTRCRNRISALFRSRALEVEPLSANVRETLEPPKFTVHGGW